MTDLEITKLCAEASRIEIIGPLTHADGIQLFSGERYDPLHDDAQCFALVKKLTLRIGFDRFTSVWYVELDEPHQSHNKNINMAICLCVANMQKAKGDND